MSKPDLMNMVRAYFQEGPPRILVKVARHELAQRVLATGYLTGDWAPWAANELVGDAIGAYNRSGLASPEEIAKQVAGSQPRQQELKLPKQLLTTRPRYIVDDDGGDSISSLVGALKESEFLRKEDEMQKHGEGTLEGVRELARIRVAIYGARKR